MVGSSPKRSSSPMLVRPNPNPNPNSRTNNLERKGAEVRKSFNGYPFAKSSLVYQQKGLIPNTPVNSPAEYARSSDGRISGGVSFQDHEQKENERDHNIKPAARAKSPSINTKGTKNFMSPTISAASKINPSPRKKVLGERNEAIRTSASLSDGKFHFFSTNSLEFDDENEVRHSELEKHEFRHQNGFGSGHGEVKIEAIEADLVVLSPEVPMNTAKSSESLPLSEMPKMDVDIKSVACSSPCTKTPLEVNPSLPPYDPKNNYLSPRPQFLHYNPNWRTESYVTQGMNLEDDFTSESVSDIENCSEEVQSEDSLKDQEDAASSVGSPLSETNPTESQQLVEKEAKIELRRCRWLANWKIVAMLLLFSIGFMSIYVDFVHTNPGIGNAMYRDEIISRVYNNPHTASLVENFSGVIQNAKILSASSIDYLSQILQNVRGVDKFSSLTFGNLTAWQEEEEDWAYMVQEFGMDPYFESIEETQGHCELQNDHDRIIENYEASVQMQSYPTPEDTDDTSTEGDEIVKLDDSQPEEVKNHEIEDEASGEIESYPTPEDTDDDTSAKGDEISQLEKVRQNYETKDEGSSQMQSYSTPEDNGSSTGQAELIEAVDFDPEVEEHFVIKDNDAVMAEEALSADEPENMEIDDSNVGEPQSDVTAEAEQSLSPPHFQEIQPKVTSDEPSENADNSPANDVQPVENETIKSIGNSQFLEASEKSLAPILAAISLVIVSLFAAFMYYYMKPKKDRPLVDQFIAEKEPSLGGTPSSWSGLVEVDMVGDSCPSEMSSFQNSTYTKTKQEEGDEEAHSQQKSSKMNYSKRESLASSSSEYTMDSSYGSFSTYSVIHPKHGDGQVVTPVRRSSRIRSKVTSP